MRDTTPHQPTDETRKTVASMASYGIPQEDISKVIGIDPKTLRKYYREELDTAGAKAIHNVAGMLYNKAMEGDTTSIIFFLKTRGKWSEKIEVDNTHKIKDAKSLLEEDRQILERLGINLGSKPNDKRDTETKRIH